MQRCGLKSRSLLEAIFGEKHAVGEVAKLLARPSAQLGLAQHRGDQPRVVTLGPQRTHQLEHIGLGVEVADRVQKRQRLRREEFGKFAAIHALKPRQARLASMADQLN